MHWRPAIQHPCVSGSGNQPVCIMLIEPLFKIRSNIPCWQRFNGFKGDGERGVIIRNNSIGYGTERNGTTR